jgi:hypothetical protein
MKHIVTKLKDTVCGIKIHLYVVDWCSLLMRTCNQERYAVMTLRVYRRYMSGSGPFLPGGRFRTTTQFK